MDKASAIAPRPFIPPADEPGSTLREVVIRGSAHLVSDMDGRPVQTTPAQTTPVQTVTQVQPATPAPVTTQQGGL